MSEQRRKHDCPDCQCELHICEDHCLHVGGLHASYEEWFCCKCDYRDRRDVCNTAIVNSSQRSDCQLRTIVYG